MHAISVAGEVGRKTNEIDGSDDGEKIKTHSG